MARIGVNAPKRQGAVSACTSGSDINPVIVGGVFQLTPTAVSNWDAVRFPTDSYGRLLVVPNVYDGNTETTLLASASRTSSCATADQTNYNARGVTVWFDVTVAPASGSDNMTLEIENKDPASGSYLDMLVSASVTAIGNYQYTVYPGGPSSMAVADVTETVALPLPRTWRVNVVHDSGCTCNYSLGYCYLL